MELSATELRIGNLVTDKWSVGKYPFKIVSIGKTICHYFGHQKFSAKYEDLEPIPLTEEWLLRLGFESTNTYYFSKCNLHLQGDIRGFHLVISRIDGIKVKYVHQLQNLYFALTGEELTI